MNPRWLVLALLLAPMALLGANLWRQSAGTEQLLPDIDSEAVAQIELSREGDRVLLARKAGTGTWEIPSAADAPADQARVKAALETLVDLRGRPLDASAPAQGRAPLKVRLSDEGGRPLGEAAFWAGEATRLPDGRRLALAKTPALPVWPSAWSSLQAPRIPADRIAAVEELTPEGTKLLSPEATVEVAAILSELGAKDFVAGADVGWAGAKLLRVKLTDGTIIDLQQVSDGDGRYFLRLTSDTLESVRAARRYAFRVKDALP